jgi:sec-independent protein translocase protein TatA
MDKGVECAGKEEPNRMFTPKGWEWLIILVVVLLIFGGRKLPELARSLGASAKEFRKGVQEGANEEPKEEPAP